MSSRETPVIGMYPSSNLLCYVTVWVMTHVSDPSAMDEIINVHECSEPFDSRIKRATMFFATVIHGKIKLSSVIFPLPPPNPFTGG